MKSSLNETHEFQNLAAILICTCKYYKCWGDFEYAVWFLQCQDLSLIFYRGLIRQTLSCKRTHRQRAEPAWIHAATVSGETTQTSINLKFKLICNILKIQRSSNTASQLFLCSRFKFLRSNQAAGPSFKFLGCNDVV